MATINNESSGISISCTICGEKRELTRDEAEYNRHFGTSATIYICDECKEAIRFAKWLRTGKNNQE